MPVAFRNLTNGLVCFSEPSTNAEFKWEAAGHPGGEDVQMLPDDLAQNVFILKHVRKGILAIETPEGVAEEMMRQVDPQTVGRAEAEALAAIDRTAEKPLVVLSEDALEQGGKASLDQAVAAQMAEPRG